MNSRRILGLIDPQQLTHWVASHATDFGAAVGVLVAFHIVWKVMERLLLGVFHKSNVDQMAQGFVLAVLRGALITLGISTALAQLGIDIGSILASLGVVGLTVGFAAKDTLSNVISGLFIFWDRPFVIGDLVEIGGNYGRVDKITMRSTRVVTVDGRMLAVPNSIIVNSTVSSYTNFPHLRLDLAFTVGLGEDYERVRALMLDIVRKHEQFLPTPAPEVVMTAIGDYSVELQVQVWIDDETQHIAVRNQLREQLYLALRAAKVDMPLERTEVVQVAAQ